jgi:hypothetical protein
MAPITLQTPLLGPVDTTADVIANAILTHPNRARSCLSDDEIRQFAASVVTWAGVFGVRASIAVAQTVKETNFLQYGGQVPCGSNKFAGLGATNDGAAGAVYPDISTGCAAVFTHWMAYLYGDVANWPAGVRQYQHLDERYAAVLSTGHAGKITTLATVTNGVWAYTATIPIGSLANGYATGIVSIANSIAGGVAPVPTQDFPATADIGEAVRIETTNFEGAVRDLAAIQWFVVHDTEGHWEGDIGVLTHNSQSGSVHAIIGRLDGQFCASVPIRDTAWTAGNDELGALAVQVELCKAPDESGYTEHQYRTLAAFYRWCVGQGMTNVGTQWYYPHPPNANNGTLPDVPGIIGHCGVPDATPGHGGQWGGFAHHTDPGDAFDWEHFVALIGGNTPVQPPQPDNRINGHILAGGFRALWDATPDRLRVFGLPTSEEYDGTLTTAGGILPVTAIDFERNQLVYDLSTPDPFRVRVPLRTERVAPRSRPKDAMKRPA